ncbi:MAG TPA: inosine/xanthosine triphosphatase [Candidatus Paceibacterota bacterium]|nr:inosine/xanthosine triphosphatase [Candidatus Paceibacterota bacterium]
MKAIIGSASERKIKTVERALAPIAPETVHVLGFKASSGVPETPYDKQTFDGARNRAMHSKEAGDADFYVGLESGLVERYGHMYEEAWCVVLAKDGAEYHGYSSGLKIPDYVLKRMDELGMEHCDAMTIIEKEHGDLPNDTWGNYSGGMILREQSLEEAVRNAFIQCFAPKHSFYKTKK